jgi:hypothetical protein
MSSGVITRAVVLIGALVAGPLSAQSIATEANKELPDWFQVAGLDRARFEGFLDRNFTHGENDVHFLNRLRIDLTVRATRWMRFILEGQDARIYFNRSVPNAPPFANPMGLRLGYLQLGDSDRSPVSLRAGRQDLNQGHRLRHGSGRSSGFPWTRSCAGLGWPLGSGLYHSGEQVEASIQRRV